MLKVMLTIFIIFLFIIKFIFFRKGRIRKKNRGKLIKYSKTIGFGLK